MKSGEGIGHLFAVISEIAWGTSFKNKTDLVIDINYRVCFFRKIIGLRTSAKLFRHRLPWLFQQREQDHGRR